MADETNKVRQQNTYMLTTFDNPYDPFTDWDEWYMWDMRAGYHSPGLLDRIARLSDELSEVDEHNAIQKAIDEIVRENVSGMHRKLRRGEFPALAAERERALDAQREATASSQEEAVTKTNSN